MCFFQSIYMDYEIDVLVYDRQITAQLYNDIITVYRLNLINTKDK